MQDRDALLLKRFTKQHILISIVAESFVEGVMKHQVTSNHKVRSMEITIA